MIQVISAMAHHGYLELDGGELLVRFIVQHCALPDTYQVHILLCFLFICGFVWKLSIITILFIYVYSCVCGLCDYGGLSGSFSYFMSLPERELLYF